MLVIRGTTSEECQSYCGEGCGAIEWWEGGSQACYLCTDLSLLMSFPHANDLSYPPHVFIKQSGMFEVPLCFCFDLSGLCNYIGSPLYVLGQDPLFPKCLYKPCILT